MYYIWFLETGKELINFLRWLKGLQKLQLLTHVQYVYLKDIFFIYIIILLFWVMKGKLFDTFGGKLAIVICNFWIIRYIYWLP